MNLADLILEANRLRDFAKIIAPSHYLSAMTNRSADAMEEAFKEIQALRRAMRDAYDDILHGDAGRTIGKLAATYREHAGAEIDDPTEQDEDQGEPIQQ